MLGVQANFQRKMAASSAAHSTTVTKVAAVAARICYLLAGVTLYGLLLSSNFVALPKWALYGVGIGAPILLFVFGSKLSFVAKSREAFYRAFQDGSDGKLHMRLNENQLDLDGRFASKEQQKKSDQLPGQSLADLRGCADRYGIDLPLGTAAQRLHGLDQPIDRSAAVYRNRRLLRSKEGFVKYQKKFFKISGGGAGPLFAKAGYSQAQIVTKKPPAGMTNPLEREHFRLDRLYMVFGRHAPPLAATEKDRIDQINEMREELAQLDMARYIENRQQRLAQLEPDMVLPNTPYELEKAIADSLAKRRELHPRAACDPNSRPTQYDQRFEVQKERLLGSAQALEKTLKSYLLKRMISQVSQLESSEDRASAYKALYKTISGQEVDEEPLFLRRLIDRVNLDDVSLDQLEQGYPLKTKKLSKKLGFDKEQTAASIFAWVFSSIGNLEEVQELRTFRSETFAAVAHFVSTGRGRSRLRMTLEKSELDLPAWDSVALESDSCKMRTYKRRNWEHYQQAIRLDSKIYKVDKIGYGAILTLLTSATLIASLFVKHRVASIALNSFGITLSVGTFVGQSHINSLLKKKRVLLLREHMEKAAHNRPLGRFAQQVRRDCDRLGIDGNLAVAHAMIYNKRWSPTVPVKERLRGFFIESSGAKEKKTEAKKKADLSRKGKEE
ncbi:MAG: hypothetical protein S4CHLAM81_13290 [Chlamydiales bacterium]|nr:hypothetical protein [Chlamydiales bacterium]MCH9636101.1 hypothetical protein [Chlamydiales bacterium]MCH9703467.1 hypothetical protein [Chlamydiota bacterium]